MKLTKYLFMILLGLLVIAAASTVIASADDSGLGSFLSEDMSSDGVGDFQSNDDGLDSASDDDYPEDEDIDSEDNGGEVRVKLTKHATL